LEYANVNFNDITVPEKCIRYYFCFKSKQFKMLIFIEMYTYGVDGNSIGYIPD
jgi:hypothetical protein